MASSDVCWIASRVGTCNARSTSAFGATRVTCTPTTWSPIAVISVSARSAASIAAATASAAPRTASSTGTLLIRARTGCCARCDQNVASRSIGASSQTPVLRFTPKFTRFATITGSAQR